MFYPSIPTGTIQSIRNRDWTINNQWFIQEKVDGSQFSFYIEKQSQQLVYSCGNTRKKESDDLFGKGMSMVSLYRDQLNPDYIYHTEYISLLRHNIVDYERLPKNYFIVYDIQQQSTGDYLELKDMITECERLGFEYVPTLADGTTNNNQNPADKAEELLRAIEDGTLQSVLGSIPEGIVLKHHKYVKNRGTSSNTKIKFVSNKFKEVHCHQKKPPAKKLMPFGFLIWLGSLYRTEARLHKGIQHLRDKQGIVKEEYKDVNEYVVLLSKELDDDLLKEHKPVLINYIVQEFTQWQSVKTKILKKREIGLDTTMFKDVMDDPCFQLILNHDELMMDQFLQIVCEHARKGLDQFLCTTKITVSSIFPYPIDTSTVPYEHQIKYIQSVQSGREHQVHRLTKLYDAVVSGQ